MIFTKRTVFLSADELVLSTWRAMLLLMSGPLNSVTGLCMFLTVMAFAIGLLKILGTKVLPGKCIATMYVVTGLWFFITILISNIPYYSIYSGSLFLVCLVVTVWYDAYRKFSQK